MTTTPFYEKELYQYVKKTPILTNSDLDELAGCQLFFKCENLQVTGSFKYRGACNSLLALTKNQDPKGVITVSSGNHGAALAKAGKVFGVKTHIIVPENSAKAKIANIKKYGAQISYCSTNPTKRQSALESKQQELGYHLIPAYNYMDVIHGQSSCAHEIFTEISDLDSLICPVSGGGLASGTILARDNMSKNTQIFLAEPQGADDAFQSFAKGELIFNEKPDTICDGLRANLGDITYPIIKKGAKEIITLQDEEVLAALDLISKNLKIIIEPSSAITLAAILKEKLRFKGQKIALILTGGNYEG